MYFAKRLLFFLIVPFLAGCSSIFYYPMKEELVDRSRLSIQPEDVWFESEDGTKLHGWYFKSPTKPKGKIIFFHGNAQNLSAHFYFLYTAPTHGYDYFIFDYRGYGKSEGKAKNAGVRKDTHAALRWIQKRNPELPLIVFAQSLGGALALRATIDLRDEIPITAMVVDSAFSNFRSEASAILRQHWLTWILSPIGWVIVDNSLASRGELNKLCPIPMFVSHGTKDTIVPEFLGEDIYKEITSPKVYVQIPNGRHTQLMFAENRKYAKEMFEFLDRAVKTPAPKALPRCN